MKKALVIGVGPLNGLGAQLCKKLLIITSKSLWRVELKVIWI